MVKQTIQIYARLKPARKNAAGLYSVEEDDGRTPLLEFVVPRDLAEGFVNNKRESYKFQFKKIFDQQAKQEEIFETIARPVADSVLSGYNGTIFAYGQTGSGKTFTITGGAERFADRGIIPRILGYLFEQFQKDTNRVYTAHISYLEIYNENGYDLLNPRHEASKLEDLPKVTLMEDTEQIVHLKNLSLHQASSQEEALNLLFLGDTNRMIAETPMNQASTRSHCIFTLHVCGREPGSTTLCRSKLHLVDLAGSERVSKTGVGGILLTEAKYINLSLHYLEQVIIALSEKNRSHVPYRNSMMTSVLRDSLGGNCMTTMIATLAVDKRNIDESISTCRFAQRVALIKNEAILNEEVDPRLVIVRLKKEIQQLRDELALVTGQPRTEDLDAVELQQLEEMVRGYVEDADADASLEVGADMRKIHHCFSLLKRHIRQGRASSGGSERENPSKKNDDPGSESDIRRLKELVQQRDNEINVLVSMLKKERKHVQDVGRQLQALTGERDGGPKVDGQRETVAGYDKESEWVPAQSRDHYMSSSSSFNGKNSAMVYGEKSTGRKEAFDIFRRDYADNITIEDNKYILKQRYAEAKALGETVNQARSKINQLKSQIDHRRMQRAAQGVSKALPGVDESDPVEEDLRARIEGEKSSYKEAFTRLKVLKTEIEHLQHLLEKAKLKLQRDFDDWWAGEVARRVSAKYRIYKATGDEESIEAPGSTIPLTGDSKIDADILAFVQARQKLTHGKGAAVFQVLELPAEQNIRQRLMDSWAAFIQNHSCVDDGTLDLFLQEVLDARSHGVRVAAGRASSPSNWDFSSALLFTVTVVTTIGYGSTAPGSPWGRASCAFYALLGMPLNLHLLSRESSSFWEIKWYSWCIASVTFVVAVRRAGLLVLGGCVLGATLLCLLLPVAVLPVTEGWSPAKSLYYAFITLSTIGFGDLVVGSEPGREYVAGYRTLVAAWIVASLACLAATYHAFSTTALQPEDERSLITPQDDDKRKSTARLLVVMYLSADYRIVIQSDDETKLHLYIF
ncbi:unnamed protein product [Lampetra fluviatilis]